jgi:hypothetical protein
VGGVLRSIRWKESRRGGRKVAIKRYESGELSQLPSRGLWTYLVACPSVAESRFESDLMRLEEGEGRDRPFVKVQGARSRVMGG